MSKITALLLVAFLFITSATMAQEPTMPDTTAPPAAPTTDTTVLQSTTVTDTVKHVYNMDSLNKSTDSLGKVQDAKHKRELLMRDAIQAENDKIFFKKQISILTMKNMLGRGYVKSGSDSAAIYVLKAFKGMKLKPVANNNFMQTFAFPVNTFPGRMRLFMNNDSLHPGTDYIVEPSSSSYTGNNLKVRRLDMNAISDREALKIVLRQMDSDHAFLLENVDLFCSKVLDAPKEVFLSMLPHGCYIIPQDGKLQWGVSRDTIAATVFYVRRGAMPKTPKTLYAMVNSQFVPRFRTQNIVGCIPGVVKDSFLVFSAHYDYLGMMGNETAFPGANDGASGLAMLMYLANYFTKHTPHYTVVFAAFGGEEASLMGSEFFVKSPPLPIKNVRFLVNLDMMGDATKGVSVVNAPEYPAEFGLLKEINDREHYVADVRGRRNGANGDQYYFARAGVPCFFLYGEGPHFQYHDINDRAKDITANKSDAVMRLLTSFAQELK